jgi:hypothetical protein
MYHIRDRSAYKVLVEKYEGKNRCRWDDNIKIFVKEQDGRLWTGFIRLRTGASGRLL